MGTAHHAELDTLRPSRNVTCCKLMCPSSQDSCQQSCSVSCWHACGAVIQVAEMLHNLALVATMTPWKTVETTTVVTPKPIPLLQPFNGTSMHAMHLATKVSSSATCPAQEHVARYQAKQPPHCHQAHDIAVTRLHAHAHAQPQHKHTVSTNLAQVQG